MQAANCDRCYRRKGKCDRLVPCTACEKAGSPCVYTDRSREKTIRPDVVERLEKRLEATEQRNKALLTEVSRLRTIADGAEVLQRDSQSSTSATATVVSKHLDILQRTNEVAAQVSYLSNAAAGERQYLGSASGLLFADLVRASVDMPVPRNSSPPPEEDADAETADIRPQRRIADDSASRPSHKLACQLIKAYLDHDYLQFPFLIEKDVYQSLDAVYRLSSQAVTAYDSFVIDMLFAISTAHVSIFDWTQLPSAESHHIRAMSHIHSVLALGGLRALNALLLLCQFRTGSSIQDNSGSMYHLVGIASRLCFEVGLHKRSSYPLSAKDGSDADLADEYIRQEARRKTFWGVVAFDRLTSIILGRPFAIRDYDYDHAPPEETDSTQSSEDSSPRAASEKPFMFYHIVRYRILCGKIASTLHRKRDNGVTVDEVFRQRDQLHDDLEQWYQAILKIGLAQNHVHKSAEPKSCFLTLTWYQMIRANALLMIWRPAPLFADIPETDTSLQHIFEAAKQSIIHYASLHKTRQLNYSWITLQSLFMAGLSYIFAVSNHFRTRRGHQPSGQIPPRRLLQDPSPLEVVNDTRACSKVLVAVSERWNALRHCHDVFDRLSDAVLADAVKLQTSALSSSECNSGTTRSPEVTRAGQVQQQPAALLPSTSNDMMNLTPHQQHLQMQPVNSTNAGDSWMAGNDMMSSATTWGFSTYSPLQVDNEFLHCYNDLQDLYSFNQINDPVIELSQDWLGNLGTGDEVQRRGNGQDGSLSV